MADDLYVQCRFEQLQENGDMAQTVAWIPERAAKVGFRVELKGEEGLWNVVAAEGPPMSISKLREKQAADRGQREASDI